MPIDEVVKIKLVDKMRVPIFEGYEFSFCLEESIILRHVLCKDDIGEIDGSLDIAVVRSRHGTIH